MPFWTQARRYISLRTERWSYLTALVWALVILFFVLTLPVKFGDINAYWNAALRIREGLPLYVATDNVHQGDLYRYAPWFAVAWVPLTFLPFTLVIVLWELALTTAALAVCADAWQRNRLLVLFCGPPLIWSVAYGNVQPLLIAALYFGVQRRSGPLWIALCGSLKAAPILLVLVYLGRRQWTRAVVCLAVFAVLVAPMLLLPGYTANPGLTLSLYGWAPTLYVILAAFAAVVALRRATWMAGAVVVVASLPRLLLYDFSFLLIGARR